MALSSNPPAGTAAAESNMRPLFPQFYQQQPNPNSSIYTYRPSIWFRPPGPPLGFMAPPIPNPPNINQTPVMDNNGVKEARDRSRDGSFMVVRDRKVTISEDSSLYALCRSWLRNGLPEETEPQYIDIVKSLPRPLPLAPRDSHSPAKNEEQEEDEEEGGGFVEHLSPQDLLRKHIKRAKRVRSRLREERLRRIARYKTRLSLLLPPIVEQHYRNESTAGNGNTS